MIMADETQVPLGEDLNLYADEILFNNDPLPRVAGPASMEKELTDNFYITNDHTGITLHHTSEGWVNIYNKRPNGFLSTHNWERPAYRPQAGPISGKNRSSNYENSCKIIRVN